jgi:hypothetical protein
MSLVDFRIGDRVQLRKPHACGGSEWDVVRLGADIGFKCLQCGRRVLLPRSRAERRVKKLLVRGPEPEEPPRRPATPPSQ